MRRPHYKRSRHGGGKVHMRNTFGGVICEHGPQGEAIARNPRRTTDQDGLVSCKACLALMRKTDRLPDDKPRVRALTEDCAPIGELGSSAAAAMAEPVDLSGPLCTLDELNERIGDTP